MKRLALAILCSTLTLPGTCLAAPFSVNIDYVAKIAEKRAHEPFHSPRVDLPDFLRADKLDYDKYREIEFRHDKALWADQDLPFRVEFYHPGYIYQEPIKINEFTLTALQPIRFMQDRFNYRSLHLEKRIPSNTGYAGFRLLYQLNTPDKWDELGAFLGASYFRLLGKGLRYGQSARGLALDCGEPDRPEEFPIFTDWWLGKPAKDDEWLRLYAVLDSVSCVGAYSFLIKPGDPTEAEVEAILYYRDDANIHAVAGDRKPLKSIGLAPLTSMFWIGQSSPRKFDNYRPEVHDSDGLLMRFGNGETLWRPLDDPTVMVHQRFVARDLKGFGLMQRNRDFRNYEDLFNFYQQVPSVWVEPMEPLNLWTNGEVNLVELDTSYEGADNIVAFFDPATKPVPLKPYSFSYRLSWSSEDPKLPTREKVVATRLGQDPRDPHKRQFVIDYGGGRLNDIPESSPPEIHASCSDNATLADEQIFRNPNDGTWRVIFGMQPKPDNKDPVDVRCTLQRGEEALSETWTYLWSPP
jgi:glucans biosynthesis protein